LAAVREFLAAAEPTVERANITYCLENASNIRNVAGSLTMGEAFAALELEADTFKRQSIMRRLEQRIRARASEVVVEYFNQQD